MKTSWESRHCSKYLEEQLAGQIVKADSEYYDDVHQKWRPVPVHWIGDLKSEHTYKININ